MFSPLTVSFSLLKGKVKCLFQIFSMKHKLSYLICPFLSSSQIRNTQFFNELRHEYLHSFQVEAPAITLTNWA